MPVHPSVKTCTHIKVTGRKCGSPALRDERFCYFHQRMIRGVPTPPKQRIHPMALIENAEGIQAALIETINAIVRNTIDLKRATLVLRALSIASQNVRRVHFDCFEDEMVRAIPEYPPAPATVRKSETEEAPSEVAQRRDSLVPHASAGKASQDGTSPAEPALSLPKGTAPTHAQAQPPRKPPASVTAPPAAPAKAVNARPKRE